MTTAFPLKAQKQTLMTGLNELRHAGSATGAAWMQQAQKLKSLAERLDSLLQQQSRRVDATFVQAGDVPHDPRTLKQMMAEFERARATWEEQKQKDLERIKHDSARLAEAWLKLEGEQRRLLAERQAVQVGATGMALPRSVVTACKGDNGSTASAAPVQQSPSPDPWNENRPASSAELSMLEFQQLKREMQKHRK